MHPFMKPPVEMKLIRSVAAMQHLAQQWKKAGETVALVPTMGFLHEGHLELVDLAHFHADRVVTSIYVNPTQFDANEDLDAYPRDEQGDLEKLASQGVDATFLPSSQEMYPNDAQTFVELEALPHHLCGLSRPSHFRGVATICMKLFHAVRADIAVFGEKDYQQLLVIRKMSEDLLLPIQIVGAPIVREMDGLARSSRNIYLTPLERGQALALHRALQHAQERYLQPNTEIATIENEVANIIRESGGDIDYISIVDDQNLTRLQAKSPTARALVAARYGKARLIDNMVLTYDP
jgi:pantoate--beta-alanine ligase